MSLRKWHKKFARRGRWTLVVAYVYVGEDWAMIHYKLGIVGQAVATILSPLFYVYTLFQVGHRESLEDVKRLLFQNKYGSFTSDAVHRGTVGWDKLMDFLEEEL